MTIYAIDGLSERCRMMAHVFEEPNVRLSEILASEVRDTLLLAAGSLDEMKLKNAPTEAEIVSLAICIIRGQKEAEALERELAEHDRASYRRLQVYLMCHRYGKMVER